MQTEEERILLAYKAGRNRERDDGTASAENYDRNVLWLELARTFHKRVRDIKDIVFAEKKRRQERKK